MWGGALLRRATQRRRLVPPGPPRLLGLRLHGDPHAAARGGRGPVHLARHLRAPARHRHPARPPGLVRLLELAGVRPRLRRGGADARPRDPHGPHRRRAVRRRAGLGPLGRRRAARLDRRVLDRAGAGPGRHPARAGPARGHGGGAPGGRRIPGPAHPARGARAAVLARELRGGGARGALRHVRRLHRGGRDPRPGLARGPRRVRRAPGGAQRGDPRGRLARGRRAHGVGGAPLAAGCESRRRRGRRGLTRAALPLSPPRAALPLSPPRAARGPRSGPGRRRSAP